MPHRCRDPGRLDGSPLHRRRAGAEPSHRPGARSRPGDWRATRELSKTRSAASQGTSPSPTPSVPGASPSSRAKRAKTSTLSQPTPTATSMTCSRPAGSEGSCPESKRLPQGSGGRSGCERIPTSIVLGGTLKSVAKHPGKANGRGPGEPGPSGCTDVVCPTRRSTSPPPRARAGPSAATRGASAGTSSSRRAASSSPAAARARTIVASIRTATARPTPISLSISAPSVAKIANTRDHHDCGAGDHAGGGLDAVLDRARRSSCPRSNASRMRLRMNTW